METTWSVIPGIDVSINTKPLFSTVDRFLHLRCAGDVLNSGIVRDSRDIHRMMGLWDNVKKFHLEEKYGDTDVCVVEVGGERNVTPRFATFLEYVTPWRGYAFGPSYNPPVNSNVEEVSWEDRYLLREILEDSFRVVVLATLNKDTLRRVLPFVWNIRDEVLVVNPYGTTLQPLAEELDLSWVTPSQSEVTWCGDTIRGTSCEVFSDSSTWLVPSP